MTSDLDLNIKEELRQTLRKIWPLKAKKNMLDLLVPPNHELCFQNLSVGKIYAGLLILENYRARKSGAEVGIFIVILFKYTKVYSTGWRCGFFRRSRA